MPLYGRAFTGTTGLGKPYKGLGVGSWEAGVYDFKDLPLKGAQEYYDDEAEATYSWDNSTGMLVSYDTMDMALMKVDYIKKNKLGGAMWWEVSGDRNDSGSLISSVSGSLSLELGIMLTCWWIGRQRNVGRGWARHRIPS
jgi:chitinase